MIQNHQNSDNLPPDLVQKSMKLHQTRVTCRTTVTEARQVRHVRQVGQVGRGTPGKVNKGRGG